MCSGTVVGQNDNQNEASAQVDVCFFEVISHHSYHNLVGLWLHLVRPGRGLSRHMKLIRGWEIDLTAPLPLPGRQQVLFCPETYVSTLDNVLDAQLLVHIRSFHASARIIPGNPQAAVPA